MDFDVIRIQQTDNWVNICTKISQDKLKGVPEIRKQLRLGSKKKKKPTKCKLQHRYDSHRQQAFVSDSCNNNNSNNSNNSFLLHASNSNHNNNSNTSNSPQFSLQPTSESKLTLEDILQFSTSPAHQQHLVESMMSEQKIALMALGGKTNSLYCIDTKSNKTKIDVMLLICFVVCCEVVYNQRYFFKLKIESDEGIQNPAFLKKIADAFNTLIKITGLKDKYNFINHKIAATVYQKLMVGIGAKEEIHNVRFAKLIGEINKENSQSYTDGGIHNIALQAASAKIKKLSAGSKKTDLLQQQLNTITKPLEKLMNFEILNYIHKNEGKLQTEPIATKTDEKHQNPDNDIKLDVETETAIFKASLLLLTNDKEAEFAVINKIISNPSKMQQRQLLCDRYKALTDLPELEKATIIALICATFTE